MADEMRPQPQISEAGKTSPERRARAQKGENAYWEWAKKDQVRRNTRKTSQQDHKKT